MQRLKRYQGVSLDDAYARVREEAGLDAEIVSTRTVRTPGLLGSPPREMVEVVVRVSEEEIERREQLASRIEAARREPSMSPAAAAASADHGGARAAVGAAGEADLAPPFLNELAGSGRVGSGDRMGAVGADLLERLGLPGGDGEQPPSPPLQRDDGPFDSWNQAHEHERADAPAPVEDPGARLQNIAADVAELRLMLARMTMDRLEMSEGVDGLVEARRVLERQGVDSRLVASILEHVGRGRARQAGVPAVLRSVERRMAAMLPPVARIDFSRPLTIFLVGPSGAGKTTLAVRMARDVAERHALSVVIAGTDVSRAGSPQQLDALGAAAGVAVELCYSPRELRALLADAERDVVIVDTPGHQGTRRDRMTELRAFLQAADRPHVILTLPATMKGDDLLAVGSAFRSIGIQGLALTRCDETSSYGALFTAAVEGGVGLTCSTHGDGIAVPPRTGDNLALARAVLNGSWPEPAAAAATRRDGR